MSSYRVLLVGAKNHLPEDLPACIERNTGGEVLTEASAAIRDAVSRVAKNGYDAVVCWAEHEDELAGVIRIRKTRPDQPILVLTSRGDPGFGELARRAGATRTTPVDQDSAALSEVIQLAVRSGKLRKELREQTRWVQSQAGEIHALSRQTKALASNISAGIKKWPKTRFEPLLVEDDPEHAFLIVRAFEKADIFAPHPVLKSGEEAIAYLSDCRSRRALPSLVLLDVNLAGKSGLEVLAWLRREAGLSHLPVVMLSSSSDPMQVNSAYELGANSFLTKPTSFTAFVELISTLKTFWGDTNFPPGN